MKPLYKLLDEPLLAADVHALIENRRDLIGVVLSGGVAIDRLPLRVLLDIVYIEKFDHCVEYPECPSDDFGDDPEFRAALVGALRDYNYDLEGMDGYEIDRQVQAVAKCLIEDPCLGEDERLAA